MNTKYIIAVICICASIWLNVEAKKKKLDLKKFLDDVIKETFSDKSKAGQIGEINDDSCSDFASWCGKYKTYCSSSDVVRKYCRHTCDPCTTKRPTTPTASSSNCKDFHPQCNVAYNRGYCTGQPSHVDFMKRNCRKTCKFCVVTATTTTTTTAPKCQAVDVLKNCQNIKRYCGIKGYEKYMTENCAKTCGSCKGEYECGVAKRRQQNGKPIVGGSEANKGYYPWQVAIYYDEDFLCGGSLLSDQHVLTAAHCFKGLSTDTDRYEVVLGDHDRSVKEVSEEVLGVKSITQHESYQYKSDTHDVAIIQLSSKATLSDDINPICLPASNEEIPEGSKCYLTGWGKTRHDGFSVNRLMEVAMPIVSLSHCREKNTFNHHVVNHRMLCAGYDDGFNFQSGCHGDSGGPLACEKSDKSWVLHGVVSWGSPQCNGLERYTVFSRVTKYVTWIKDKMKA